MLCPVCGNETDPGRPACRFCAAEFSPESDAPQPAARLHKTVNLKHGRPLVETALRRLRNELQQARAENVRVLTLIHGYGSSGKGGAIRDESRKVLDFLMRQGEVNTYIAGERFHRRSGEGKALLRRYPQLEQWCATALDNPGITIVVL